MADTFDFTLQMDQDTLEYLTERAAHNQARGKGAQTVEAVAVEEIVYAMNRRKALAKDKEKAPEARRFTAPRVPTSYTARPGGPRWTPRTTSTTASPR